MIRKIRYSLRLKFIIAITGLLLLTMSFYLSYALGIFQSDKAADIYSTTLYNSINLADKINLLLSEETRLDEILKDSIADFNIKKDAVFKAYPSILLIECLEEQNTINFFNSKKLSELGIPSDFNLNASSQSLMVKIPRDRWGLFTENLLNLPKYYSIGKRINDQRSCMIHISIDKLLKNLEQNSKYGSYLISDTGKLFVNFTSQKIDEKSLSQMLQDPIFSNNQLGTKKFTEDSNSIIRSFAKISDFHLMAISEINERTAFMASEVLINKSIIYGVLLLSIAVIVGIIFTRRLTNGLQMLFEATQELSKGNFSVSLNIKGNDEIASLTDSFIDMKNKILKFMEEMKEKARIENEIQIAKLVQDSFFPQNFIAGNGFNIFGHYRPATECSGDWWGVLEQGNRITIIVCDATGHGVGAALVTAAAHTSLTLLKLDAQNNYVSPKMILSRMNHVICEMHSEIMMTAFALEINREEQKVVYANASHVPPYLLSHRDGVYSKDSINPLMENNNSRLGQNLHTVYSESEVKISESDKILLFSDGIIEANNGEKNYGQRNFIKSFIANANQSVDLLVLEMIKDLEKFQNGLTPDDDITLIAVEINSTALKLETVEDIEKIQLVNQVNPIVSSLDNQNNIEHVLSKFPVVHLVGCNSKNIVKEFNLINKINQLKVFAFKHFFHVNKNFFQQELYFNKNIGQEIEKLVTNCRPFFEFALKSPQVELVLDELLSNAFYHSKASPGFTRGEEIMLIPGEKIALNYFYDDEYLVVGVKGPGSFNDLSVITQSIFRGQHEKTPLDGKYGAGLGLYLIFDNVAQLWIINSPGNGSEIICVFEKFSRNKQLKERITSFHYVEMEFNHE